MTYTIKNEYLQVSLDSKGAEMTSLVDKAGINYLWTADPKHWARHAPVLFPIVGKLKNNRYTYRQKEYSLGQHGFARDLEFEVLSDFNSSVEFLLKSSPYTKEKFPFDFELSIRYALEKNKIHIFYNVRNKDTLTMLFSIGAHPGFRCPLYDNESINDYYIQFNKSETAHIMLLNHETGLFERETAPLLKNEDKIFLDHTTFENDALVFKGLRSTQATIKN
ncbi:MAG TPA: aldose 1-epimerase family protein, partial [Petrotogaceae bacterium]|nr:aldose 1-epimerase family protein [Petrotogaceae bacterium]